MRIVGNISHPDLKITIFKNDGHFSVKCETDMIEQIFKLRDDPHIQSPEDVKRMFDTEFVRIIETSLKSLSAERESAYTRHFNLQQEDFPEII